MQMKRGRRSCETEKVWRDFQTGVKEIEMRLIRKRNIRFSICYFFPENIWVYWTLLQMKTSEMLFLTVSMR